MQQEALPVARLARGCDGAVPTAWAGHTAWAERTASTGLAVAVLLALVLGTAAAGPPNSGDIPPAVPPAVPSAVPGPVAPPVAPAADARAVSMIPVVVDIAPGLCPNHLRVDSPLTIPVGVLGTEDLEITAIEPATVRLSREGLAGDITPLNYAYKDLGSPLIGGRCECRELVGDGLEDLVFYFDIKALVAALGLAGQIGETVPLTLSGKLVTGDTISGVDCALVIDADWADSRLERELGFLVNSGEQQADGLVGFAYFSDVSDHMALTIYDLRGRAIACLVDMDLAPGIYRATWDGTGTDRERVAAGTYFARVSNSRSGETLRFEIPQE